MTVWQGLAFLPTSLASLLACLLALLLDDHLVGIVVKASASKAVGPGSIPDSDFPVGICPGSGRTSNLQTGTPVATLPGAWRYRVRAETGVT